MRQLVIENPVINSAFLEPGKHFKFTDDGIPIVAFESTNWEIGDLGGYEQTALYGSYWHTPNDTLQAIEAVYPERPMVRLRAYTTVTFEFLKHLNP